MAKPQWHGTPGTGVLARSAPKTVAALWQHEIAKRAIPHHYESRCNACIRRSDNATLHLSSGLLRLSLRNEYDGHRGQLRKVGSNGGQAICIENVEQCWFDDIV